MESGLRGQRALITGGGTGIGLGLALALSAEGVDVVIASRQPRKEAVASIRANGVRASWVKADVSSELGVVRMVEETDRYLGGIDLFVNNAAGTWHESITRLTLESWDKTIATNLTACALACREVSRRMVAAGRGSILIVGSTAAHVPLYGESSYRVSKTGLKALMEVMAIELAPYSIRVNLLTPGGFLTPLTADLPTKQMGGQQIPMRRLGRVEELGHAAVFLLSDLLSSYTTGAELVIDGGFRLRPMNVWSDREIRAMNSTLPPRARRRDV
jgi:glucose 1-dehydrogenase